jgi:NagD protein
MDGTIYNGTQLFPYTSKFFETLKELKINYTYLTNNSSKSVKEYLQKLKEMNLEANIDQIYTSALGTIDYLKKNKPELNRIFVLGTTGLKAEFKKAGFTVTEDFGDIEPEAVIVGFDTSLSFDRLSKAGYWIKQGKPFIATHPDLICPTDQETLLVDCGAVCAALEKATGKSPDIVLGKPDPSMIEGIIRRNNLKTDEVAMVGDRVYTDIEMALRARVLGVLVLSGETKKDDVENLVRKPDLVVENIEILGNLLKQSRNFDRK